MEEAATISAAAARMEGKWKEVEEEGARRKEELESAMEEAKNCDEKVSLEMAKEEEERLYEAKVRCAPMPRSIGQNGQVSVYFQDNVKHEDLCCVKCY